MIHQLKVFGLYSYWSRSQIDPHNFFKGPGISDIKLTIKHPAVYFLTKRPPREGRSDIDSAKIIEKKTTNVAF